MDAPKARHDFVCLACFSHARMAFDTSHTDTVVNDTSVIHPVHGLAFVAIVVDGVADDDLAIPFMEVFTVMWRDQP